jgi:hypothetical protein
MGSLLRERGERSREANEVVRVERAFRAEKKKPSKPPFEIESPWTFAVQSSRLTRLAPVDSAVETHERDKTRSVASVFADGDERVRHARAWGGASGAEEAAARRRAFARGVARHARAEGRPDRPPRRLGVPPAPDPPSRENSLSSIVRYFSCAFFGRETRVGERRCPGHHAHAARRAAVRASRLLPCRRAWTCGSWLCRCTPRSTPADLPRHPTEGAICGTAWMGRAGTARRTPGARPAGG